MRKCSWMIIPSLALAGCQHALTLSGVPSTPYHRLESSLARQARFYGLSKVQYVTTVIYKSPALREAYVEEYARKYQVTEEERQALLRKEHEEAATHETFLISHYATDKDTAKLTKETRVWRLSLFAQSPKPILQDPESVSGLSAQDTVLQYFYPQITPWSKVFLVQFAKQPSTSSLKLKMVGVVDNLTFSWTEKDL